MGMYSDIWERNQEMEGQRIDEQNKLENALDAHEERMKEFELNRRLAAAHRYTA